VPFRRRSHRGCAGRSTDTVRLVSDRLKVGALHLNGELSNPLGDDFDYASAFNAIDCDALNQNIEALLTSSVKWWPADYGNYGP